MCVIRMRPDRIDAQFTRLTAPPDDVAVGAVLNSSEVSARPRNFVLQCNAKLCVRPPITALAHFGAHTVSSTVASMPQPPKERHRAFEAHSQELSWLNGPFTFSSHRWVCLS
jgi:hypothetical protein